MISLSRHLLYFCRLIFLCQLFCDLQQNRSVLASRRRRLVRKRTEKIFAAWQIRTSPVLSQVGAFRSKPEPIWWRPKFDLFNWSWMDLIWRKDNNQKEIRSRASIAIGADWSWNKIYRNIQYFWQYFKWEFFHFEGGISWNGWKFSLYYKIFLQLYLVLL